MIKKTLILSIIVQTYIITQSDVKKYIKNIPSKILNIKSYKANIYMKLNIQELQKYFENISIDLTYISNKKKIHVDGVPLLPNNAILKKQIKNSINKLWDYLLFPYIFDIFSKEQLLSSASVSESGKNGKTVTINNSGKELKNISKIRYIIDGNLLPEEILIFYTNGATKLIKLGFEKVTDKEYTINTVREEFKTRGGNNVYTSNADISYSKINNFMLPTQVSYGVKFSRIPDNEFKTLININYKMVITDEKFKSKYKKTKAINSQTSEIFETFGTKKDGSTFGKLGNKSDENPKKAECAPPTK